MDLIKVFVRTEGGMGPVTAHYGGGPYIDLTFYGKQATEVINVWDYRKGISTCERKPEAIEAKVRAWIATIESEGWTHWHRDYIRNARGH
jgi:hypothetical protein